MDFRDKAYFEFQPDPEFAFPPDEYRERLMRIREQMSAEGIDCLFLAAPESMYYVSGYQCEWYQAQSPKEWPATSGIAIHVDSDSFILFDSEREAILSRVYTASEDTRFFPRDSLRDGTQFIADELKAEGWLRGTVGLEYWSYRPNRVISHRFENALSAANAKVVDGSEILREIRRVKSPREVECLKEAGRIANIGLAAAKAAIAPGVTELEVYGAMVQAMAAAGGENPGITMPVLSGTKANCAHALASRKRLMPREIVLVDLCGVYKRYHVNMARSFVLGEPPREIRTVAEKAAGSMQVIAELLRPGLPVRELTDALHAYYLEQGIWSHRGWVGGYEMGIAFPPDWVGSFVYAPLEDKNADAAFVPGTAVNYENQFFLPRHIGMYFMIETLLFEEAAARLLGDMPYDLMVIE